MAELSQSESRWQWLLRPLSQLFRIDLRALATLRVAIGILILCDLVRRLPTLELFYSDAGFFTREISRAWLPPAQGYWSLYWLNGSVAFAQSLLVVNAIAALMLIVGFRTRTATVVCLVLAWSLQVRMPLVLTAGHVLLRMILFWSLFLPWGRVWSVDARKQKRPGSMQVASVATAALLLQIAMMYLFSGIAKWNEVWLRGEAVELALGFDMYVKPFGRTLLGYSSALKVITFGTLLLELIGPLLLFMPYGRNKWRVALLVLFCAMHLGVWATMSIGIFTLVAMASWIVFVPSSFWDRFFGPCAGEETESHLSTPLAGVAGVFLVFVILMNTANTVRSGQRFWFPKLARVAGNLTMSVQEFKMFARPSPRDHWFSMPALLTDGRQVELFGGRKSELASPLPQRPSADAIYRQFPGQHWRRLFFNLATFRPTNDSDQKALTEIRSFLGKILVKTWAEENRLALDQIESTKLLHFTAPISDSRSGRRVRQTLWYEW